jgi:hypothetical protein
MNTYIRSASFSVIPVTVVFPKSQTCAGPQETRTEGLAVQV